MTTFADYSHQTMASSVDDFTLYPYSEVWPQGQQYIPSSTYQDQEYMNATSFEPFQYSHDQFSFDVEHQLQHSKSQLQPPSPAYSPSNSASQSFDYQQPPVLSSTSDSGASVPSTISSAMGSPSAQPQSNEWQHHSMGMLPGIVHHDNMAQSILASTGFDMDTIPITDKGCVDPALIQPFSPTQYTGTQFPEQQQHIMASPQIMQYHAPPSPAQSMRIGKAPSPYSRSNTWQPYPAYNGSRRQSVSSVHSRHSQGSHASDDSNKGLCPIPTCGRHFKDLKAHMLTHQNERPEKCPIPTCEYHTKGFARKYDKNRHTLTHYKGTMVCGFCPGSGSAAEKSFNRADVFKRHLTSVHNVEQTPPNSRKKSPNGTTQRKSFGQREVSGMCSTCGVTFANAQDFYEHLDDCVLRVVQQADPSEAINEKLLNSVADDEQVQETMEKHMLPTTVDYDAPTTYDEAEDDEEDAEDDEDADDSTYGSRLGKSGKSRKQDAGNSS